MDGDLGCWLKGIFCVSLLNIISRSRCVCQRGLALLLEACWLDQGSLSKRLGILEKCLGAGKCFVFFCICVCLCSSFYVLIMCVYCGRVDY